MDAQGGCGDGAPRLRTWIGVGARAGWTAWHCRVHRPPGRCLCSPVAGAAVTLSVLRPAGVATGLKPVLRRPGVTCVNCVAECSLRRRLQARANLVTCCALHLTSLTDLSAAPANMHGLPPVQVRTWRVSALRASSLWARSIVRHRPLALPTLKTADRSPESQSSADASYGQGAAAIYDAVYRPDRPEFASILPHQHH